MPARIIVDPNTYLVEVRHDLKTPVFPTDETVAIGVLSEDIRKQMAEFIQTKHEPLVAQLLQKVDLFNVANDPVIAEQRAREAEDKKAKALVEQKKEPVKVKIKKKGTKLTKKK